MDNKNPHQIVTEADILKELSTLDPLDDRAFRIFISDDEQFTLLAEAFSGEALDGEKIIHMNGEIVLTANGRLIRTDALRGTATAFFNMEGQIETADFPLKRHIFYTAVIYANGIQKGDTWEKLKPVISIVIYKDKTETALIEKGTFYGDLFKTDNDRKQMTLIAVNTAKWKDAPTEELRACLSTLHHGIMTESNKSDFADIDKDGAAFTKIQRAVRMACAQTIKQEYKKKGDDSMVLKYETYLTKEEREEAEIRGEARGKAEGIAEGASKVIELIKSGLTPEEALRKITEESAA
ncbi:MAG: hypothetical protein FWB80_14380 [Defluviitaleaceae bacterium]|nr:hypothetical protein [Defluviitaleaceae bacterium]